MNKLITDVLKEGDITGMTEEGALPIKGTLEKDQLEYIYFQDDPLKSFDEQSSELFKLAIETLGFVRDGCTMMSTNTVIITPDNILFHGKSFSSPDPKDWRKDIKDWIQGFENAVKILGILGGQIQGPKMTFKEFVNRLEGNDIDTEEYVNLISYKRIGQKFDLVLTDGTKYKLSDCEIYMPFGDGDVFDNKIDGIREVLKGRTRES